MNEKELQKELRGLLSPRKFYTTKELISLGLFGSKSTVHRYIKQAKLKTIWTTDRRLMITRDSVIELILSLN